MPAVGAARARVAGIFYGWWMLAASVIINTYGGGIYSYGFGVLFKPISTEFGWSRAATAGAFSLSSLEGAFEGPIVGPLIDKFGPRVMNLIGVTLIGFGFLALALFVNSLFVFYLVYFLLISVGHNCGFFYPTQAAVGYWFTKRRTIALAILSASFGLGGAMMTPILGWLVGQYGWRVAAIAIGIGMFIIGLPLSLFLRHRPELYGLRPDGEPPKATKVEQRVNRCEVTKGVASSQGVSEVDFTIWEAMRTRVWWLLAFAYGLRGMGTSAVIIHQVPFLTDRGIDPQMAANVLGLFALMGIPGRLIFGYLGDIITKRYLMTATFVLQSIGLLILVTSTSIEQVFLFTLVYGLSWGSAPLIGAVRAEYFGRKSFATITGFQQVVVMVGHMVGPVFAGWAFDISGSYESAFILFAIAALLGAALNFFSKPPQPPQRKTTNGEPVR